MRLINRVPGAALRCVLGLLPFVLIAGVYLAGSQARLAANPDDKLLPAPTRMADAMQRMALEPDKRNGAYLLWADTASSLRRLGLGVAIAATLGLAIGLLTGGLPLLAAGLSPLLTALSLVPTLALLPVLFIVFGLGEVSKVALIAIGITPFIARDVQRRTEEIPAEQIVKAQTLGANTLQILCRVLLPQILPRLVDAVRLSLGAAWLFLIAAEAIASTDGLGYRVFLVRRYLAMDVILPYVAWITCLAFAFDLALRALNRRLFPWAVRGSTGGSARAAER